MNFQNTLDFATDMDQKDPLKEQADNFLFPKHNGEKVIYFCGNSLGLQPKTTRAYINAELDHWEKEAVEGHFRGDYPWMYYHKFVEMQNRAIVGAEDKEVVVMNTLTTNLHLAMVSFYTPTKTRFKIIMEGGAFPSDQYALETQVKFHGLDPDTAIVEVHPRSGEHNLRTEDILETIKEHGDTVALVLFGGVNYYTGQFYDLEKIVKVGHGVGAKVGFDLAHAAGNVPLKLHEWGCDFAVWCSYKYLNAGPGGPSGLFIHERHHKNTKLNRFAGWWGHDEESRFKMKKGFIPMEGAEGWQLSNAQIFSFAAFRASLDIHVAVGMDALREKSEKLTGYLTYVIEESVKKGLVLEIITPQTPADRGCQLSLLTDEHGKKLFDFLSKNGVLCDWREPNVIRLAPVPLYNSFTDVFLFGQLLTNFVQV